MNAEVPSSLPAAIDPQVMLPLAVPLRPLSPVIGNCWMRSGSDPG